MRTILQVSVFIFFLLVSLAGCSPALTPTPYLPPTPMLVATPPFTPTFQQQPQVMIPPSPTPVCEDGMTFLGDLTIPDGTIVLSGSQLEKQWRVQNSGTCNWDSSYRLRFLSGSPMEAVEEQALYPARAGSEVTIRILFIAPSEPGEYISIWQIYDPNGAPIGDGFFMKIIVQP